MSSPLQRLPPSAALLTRLIEAPDLVQIVRTLPPPAFSSLVRQIGVEDSGELIALATTEQLVAAFDEDLFGNLRPGEQETFDRDRFLLWLEVLLEAGSEVAARRFTELSEDFVVHALSSVVLILDNEALLRRMGEGDRAAWRADKAIESSLSEEIDGYLLLARQVDGWDAVMALILALDRDHRAYLQRILDRCAALASDYVEDLEGLAEVLSGEASLAEDVEGDREERRGRRGYVEPRAAKSFLQLAREGSPDDVDARHRDPVTRAYFRTLDRSTPVSDVLGGSARLLSLLQGLDGTPSFELRALPVSGVPRAPMREALRVLSERHTDVFDDRMEELAYLSNVLLAGALRGDRRFEPAEAAEAALATVALGVVLEAQPQGVLSEQAMVDVLVHTPADLLFRRASRHLVGTGRRPLGILWSEDEVLPILG